MKTKITRGKIIGGNQARLVVTVKEVTPVQQEEIDLVSIEEIIIREEGVAHETEGGEVARVKGKDPEVL
jgi:hypothetical protein